MCGIVAVWDARQADAERVAAMRDALRHRGPDDAGLYAHGPVALGHRRLSIIDLAGGHQPMSNEDGSVTVVFNGEIYNYRELRCELEAAGHRFATDSDTETIVHAWEQYGPACVEQFIGMFAFALWDARQGLLFAARDRLGIKPLFYRSSGTSLAVASELKALVQDPQWHPQLDPAALDDYLAYGYVPGDRCILAGVQKLPPGCWLVCRNGHVTVQRYWDVRFGEDGSADEDEWAERIETLLRDAVRLRLRADVPLGVFLSGGLDSSAIVALASVELGKPVETYSVGFQDENFNELDYARQVAGYYGTDHHEIIVRERDISVLEALAWHLDEPFADPSALPTWYICREARRYVKVCLSGDGGDETFAGYTRYSQAMRYARVDVVPALLRRLAGSAALAVLPRRIWGRGLIERLSHSGPQRYFAQVGAFPAAERRALLAGCTDLTVATQPRRLVEAYERSNGGHLVSTLQQIDQRTYLPDDILVKVDRMSMAHSLEVRVPLLDHRVVEAINAAPVRFKWRDGRGKVLMRRILRNYLPESILERPKRGFGIPIGRWFREALEGYARDLLLSGQSRCGRYLQRRAVERLLRDHAAGMRDLSRRIWTLLMFEHWCRAYGF